MTTETKLTSVDGYTIVDVEGATRLVGPVRSAKKVLQRTTTDLVRHATYACAVHELDASGAAVALNHDRGAEDQSPIASFANEVATWAEANSFVGAVGLGLGADEVGGLISATAATATEAAAASVIACLPANTQTIVIASDGEEPALTQALTSEAVSHEPDLATALTSEADVVFVRGKTGTLNHDVLDGTNVGTIIGLQALTTTARGLAVAGRAGAIIVPDFISAAGPILAALGWSTDDITQHTTTLMAELASHGTDMFVAASERAETHLATLTETLPFGRPLAP